MGARAVAPASATGKQNEASHARLSQLRRENPVNRQKDGFVFSTREIHDAIDRQQRLARAATMDFTKYKARKFQAHAA